MSDFVCVCVCVIVETVCMWAYGCISAERISYSRIWGGHSMLICLVWLSILWSTVQYTALQQNLFGLYNRLAIWVLKINLALISDSILKLWNISYRTTTVPLVSSTCKVPRLYIMWKIHKHQSHHCRTGLSVHEKPLLCFPFLCPFVFVLVGTHTQVTGTHNYTN